MVVIPCHTRMDPSAILKKIDIIRKIKSSAAKGFHAYFHVPFSPCIVQMSQLKVANAKSGT